MIAQAASLPSTPDGYTGGLRDLKTRIHSAQQRAALAVNRELVLLYWQIGRDILARQARQGWGTKVIERLAHDLRVAITSWFCGTPVHGVWAKKMRGVGA